MISFYSEYPNWSVLHQKQLSVWLHQITQSHGYTIREMTYVFCDDTRIIAINQQFLKHNYPTDIITFPYEYHPVHAEIYISLDTLKRNAISFKVPFHDEFLRVVAHGLLHMIGFNDKSDEERKIMRYQEEQTILLFKSLYPNIVFN